MAVESNVILKVLRNEIFVHALYSLYIRKSYEFLDIFATFQRHTIATDNFVHLVAVFLCVSFELNTIYRI